jgi:hypothetical protein
MDSGGVRSPQAVAAAVSGFAVALASWLILYLRVWIPGLETSFKDARHYLASAARWASTGRLELLELRLQPVAVVSEPLSSFPPVTSWALGSLVAAGASIEHAPTLLALAAWPLLLAAIAWLTHRLCRDPVLAALAVGIAAVTWPYLNVYTEVSSEILFLPLVVLATAIFTGLPEREGSVRGPLLLGAAATTLVLLSRYTGMFFYAALLTWWVWHRIRRDRIRRLVPELAILAVPGSIFLVWIARNAALTGHLFGPTLMAETLGVGYDHVVETFLTQSTWLVLPAVRPGAVWRAYGVAGALGVAAITAVGAALLLGTLRRRPRLPSSPLVPFLVLYVGFLAVAPAFMRMQGMTERYMAVVLALAQPFLIARLVRAPKRWARGFLAAFLGLQVGLALAFTAATAGLGAWVEPGPLRATDLAGRTDDQMRQLLAGAPAWWVHRPPRLHDLERHLPELHRVVDRLDPETPIVSNAPELFSWRPLLPVSGAVELWLERGGCHPPVPVAAVVVDWDRWTAGGETARDELPADRLRALLEDRCPDAPRLRVPRATVLLLSPERRRPS